MVYIPSRQCDRFRMVIRSLTVKGIQISNSQVEVVAGGGAKEVPEVHIRKLYHTE